MISEEEIRNQYTYRYKNYLKPMEQVLEDFVYDHVKDYSRLDRVVCRAKDISSFVDKALREIDGIRKYSDPLNQIQDQMGVRIITFYTSDLKPIQKIVIDYFPAIEEQRIVPDNASQFGYEGIHYILLIPDDVRDPKLPKDECPEFFELQIKTLFQHAWAEANHDLAYKSETLLELEQKRKVAFTAAQAWGADHIFNELVKSLGKKAL
jgi:putative GTP pyrophosphokinase